MTDVNGNLAYKAHFDPYGQPVSEWAASGNTQLTKRKFTGYERDAATGLDYARARMFTSARGRFTSPDPAGMKAVDMRVPQSLNRYSYVINDPVNHVDPSGMLTLIIGGFGNGDATPWGNRDSPFWQALRDTFGEDPRVWRWSGEDVTILDLYSGIVQAGRDLARHLNEEYEFEEGEALNIVAHSHGGNVVKIASLLLAPGRSIDNLVTLGTPQNYDLPIVNFLAVKNHCNVSSLADPIQYLGSSPVQIYFTGLYAARGFYYAGLAAWALARGDYFSAARYTRISADYLEASAEWYLSTKIDLFASKNVILGSESHEDLPTSSTWNKVKGSCGLP